MGKIKEIIDEILETTSAHNYRAKNAVLASAELTALIERATTAERERDEARAELERVKAERDSAQSFIRGLIEDCDKDGTLPQFARINLTAAKVAAGTYNP